MSMTIPLVPESPVLSLASEVDTILEAMRYPDLVTLRERLTVFKRIPRNLPGYPIARPNDCMGITDLLEEFFVKYERYFSTGDKYISRQFFSIIEDFFNSDITTYPTEVLRLNLVKTRALIAIGSYEEAVELISPYAQRPYLVEDQYGLLVKLMELDTLARLAAGRAEDLTDVALGRMRLLASWRPRETLTIFELMVPAISIRKPSHSESLVNFILRKIAQIIMFHRTRLRRFNLRTLLHHILPIEFFLARVAAVIIRMTKKNWHKSGIQIASTPGSPPLQQLLPVENSNDRNKPVLVTRAMGGLGDLAMMTPGVNVLAKRFGKPVYFATKKAFFPVFENNPDVRLIDIDTYFDVSQFRRWYNVSNCSATRYEVANTPQIKKSRVETFGRGMGVRKWSLNIHGWAPIIKLSDEQKDYAKKFRAEHKADGRPLIGIQPYSRDTYKNCDAIFDAARLLSEKYRVVIMHTSPLPIESNENIIVATGQPLREVVALVSAMDYYIAVDSAFYHITAAFKIPTLGIFGPTDGKPLSIHHPRHHVAALPLQFACSPCWRSENAPCIMTHNNRSACLNSISAENLVEEFKVLEKKYPDAIRA